MKVLMSLVLGRFLKLEVKFFAMWTQCLVLTFPAPMFVVTKVSSCNYQFYFSCWSINSKYSVVVPFVSATISQ